MILKIKNPKWKNRWEYYENISEIAVGKDQYYVNEDGDVFHTTGKKESKESGERVEIDMNFISIPTANTGITVCFCKRNGIELAIAFDPRADVYLLNNDGKMIETL